MCKYCGYAHIYVGRYVRKHCVNACLCYISLYLISLAKMMELLVFHNSEIILWVVVNAMKELFEKLAMFESIQEHSIRRKKLHNNMSWIWYESKTWWRQGLLHGQLKSHFPLLGIFTIQLCHTHKYTISQVIFYVILSIIKIMITTIKFWILQQDPLNN